MEKVIKYETEGTCCSLMMVKVDDGIIKDAYFEGGCNGNLQGIRSLIIGMKVDDVIEKLQGISCNGGPTSCPDQLTHCLMKYKAESSASV